MTELDNITSKYKAFSIQFEKLKEEVIYTLAYRTKKADIPIHMIEGRVKTLDSILGKAKRMDTQTPFDSINDICGVRIICLFLSDLTKIEEIITNTFEVVYKDNKIESKQQDQFGYFSVHYICKLPESLIGARYEDIKDLRFEVQVRTIAMHAWATISHYLDYKSPQAMPSELKKDFQALSGLFYVADSHFELFFKSSMVVREEANKRIKQGSDLSNEEINLDTLRAFLSKRYPSRLDFTAEDLTELVGEIVDAGYKSLAEVKNDLDKAAKAFEHIEDIEPPGDASDAGDEGLYSGVGVVRISLSIVNPKYLKMRGHREQVADKSIRLYKEARKFL